MIQWWNSLTALQQILACCAVPATIVLVIQTILLIVGISGGDGGDTELEIESALEEGADFDEGAEHAEGVRILTVRGIVAFFAVGGWLGIAMTDIGLPASLACGVGVLGGILALLSVAWILKFSLSLQENGVINAKNAIAGVGTVYLTIPPKRSGTGKVTLTVQNRFLEMEAVSDEELPLKTDTQIQVIGIAGENVLLVRPLQTVSFSETKIKEEE